MAKAKVLVAYVIMVVVVTIALVVISKAAWSSWLNSVGTMLAILVAFCFHKSLSVVVTGILVAFLTFVVPIGLLLAIGAGSGVSLWDHLGVVGLVQFVLPTLSAVALLTILSKRGPDETT